MGTESNLAFQLEIPKNKINKTTTVIQGKGDNHQLTPSILAFHG
jgi:hypothetical protein